jgi:hypothetical protein
MSEREHKELREKILKGIQLAYSKLLQESKKSNRYLVISRDGREIEQVKAAELMVRNK